MSLSSSDSDSSDDESSKLMISPSSAGSQHSQSRGREGTGREGQHGRRVKGTLSLSPKHGKTLKPGRKVTIDRSVSSVLGGGPLKSSLSTTAKLPSWNAIGRKRRNILGDDPIDAHPDGPHSANKSTASQYLPKGESTGPAAEASTNHVGAVEEVEELKKVRHDSFFLCS
jgi:hypothetical protein